MIMAEGAGTEPTTSPTPPAEPAGGGAAPSAAPPTPAPPPSGGDSPPATAAPGTAAQPPTSKEPPQFPWSEHRKLKNQLERYERDLNDRNERLKAVEAERASWQQNQQALAQKAKDFDALATVLQRNPALADEIERAIHGEPTTARAAQAVAQLPPEFLKQWNEMRQQLGVVTKGWQEQETLRRQAFEQQEIDRKSTRLNSSHTVIS